ncbi:hypothetical protein [Stenotrophomonas sp. MMGLT7]|uniref:hypothetical protein n=1 Tax=Stenotrophomonas sp. MMGLT7 TaxID=2901227 RepID=UPI001E416719|nr:hypothetical protein [Stenotrophomonas sp. MMGLT7]MCD7099154.1 hypothetical protein [Stenotrophomonas sp. MMGLT7]
MSQPRHAAPATNVQAELDYWHGIHAAGRLGGQHEFDEYRSLLRLGYRVYQAYPHADQAQLYRVLQEGYHRHRPALSVPWEEARWLVRSAWEHMRQGETDRLH